MGIFGDMINYIIDMGASAMLPLVIAILSIIVGVKIGKAVRAGLMVGVGFVGLGLIVDMMNANLGPAAQQMSKNFGLSMSVVDLGWPGMSPITWASSIATVAIPVAILVNIIMLVLKLTKTVNIDIWNICHMTFTGAIAYAVTGNFAIGIGGVVVHAIIAYKFGDLYAPLMEDYFELDGITVPHGTGTWMAPFAFAIDAIIEKIPGLNKIDFSIDNLQEKVGVLAEPIVIGGILGAIVGALAGYDFSAAFQLGIKMSAVMVLMPKITKCIMDGLMPLSERMKEILTKKSQSGEAEFYIGLDPAIILGDSEVVTVGLIFIPLTILIAIIVPGNTILPFGDLATIGFFIGIAVAVHRGNLFRSLISGCVIMFTTIWIASQAIPWTTALAKSVNLTNGASQVAALDQGGSPITYLYTQIVTQQNIKGLVIIGIIYVICMIFTVRGSKQRAAALKESEY